MKKITKIIGSFIIIFIILTIYNFTNAATVSIDIPQTIEIGNTISVSVTVNAAQWNLSIKVNGTTIASSNELNNATENLNKTFSGSYIPQNSGTVNFTITGDYTDINGTTTTINETRTVTVKDVSSSGGSSENNNSGSTSENTGSGGSSNSNSNSDSNTQTPTQQEKEPTFTNVNDIIYAKNSMNVRKSYSTNSSIVGTLKKGEAVNRIGIGDNGWSKIQYKGSTAYVSTSLMTNEKPEKENNAELGSLNITPSNLSPKFDPSITQYTMKVGMDVDNIKIEAKAQDDNAKVTIDGNESLEEGENTITIQVTAEDGTKKTYTIKVTKSETSGIGLELLEIKGITLSPSFSSNIYEYTAELEDSDITQLEIETVANEEDAKIEIIGNEELKDGENIITIMVTSQDGEIATYQITVKKTDVAGITALNFDIPGMQRTFRIISVVIGATILAIIALVIWRYRTEQRDITMEEDDEFGGYGNINSDYEQYKFQEENPLFAQDDEEEEIVPKRKGKHF